MSLAKSAALLLSTDLREVARQVQEVHQGLGIVERNLEEAFNQTSQGDFLAIRLDLLREDVQESRDRLGKVLEDLTGRKPA